MMEIYAEECIVDTSTTELVWYGYLSCIVKFPNYGSGQIKENVIARILVSLAPNQFFTGKKHSSDNLFTQEVLKTL